MFDEYKIEKEIDNILCKRYNVSFCITDVVLQMLMFLLDVYDIWEPLYWRTKLHVPAVYSSFISSFYMCGPGSLNLWGSEEFIFILL